MEQNNRIWNQSVQIEMQNEVLLNNQADSLATDALQFLEKDSTLTEPVSTAARSGPARGVRTAAGSLAVRLLHLHHDSLSLLSYCTDGRGPISFVCYELSNCSNFNYKSPCQSDSYVIRWPPYPALPFTPSERHGC